MDGSGGQGRAVTGRVFGAGNAWDALDAALAEYGEPPCAQTDPEVFFPRPGQERIAEVAKRVCRRCPVKVECGAAALSDPEVAGIWGGFTATERRNMRADARRVAV